MKFINFITRTSLSIVLASAAMPALAHHSFAMFETQINQPMSGVVKEFQWTNPHAWLQLMVPDDKGQLVEWSLELGSPNMLSHSGFNKKTFQPGDKLNVVIHPMRDNTPGGQLTKVFMPDGKGYAFSEGGNSFTPIAP